MYPTYWRTRRPTETMERTKKATFVVSFLLSLLCLSLPLFLSTYMPFQYLCHMPSTVLARSFTTQCASRDNTTRAISNSQMHNTSYQLSSYQLFHPSRMVIRFIRLVTIQYAFCDGKLSGNIDLIPTLFIVI